MRHNLDAREYKLLLNPSWFAEPRANTFWRDRIMPIIECRLKKRENGESRAVGSFGTPKERIIRFWDTPNCTLTGSDFALRTRAQAKSGVPEITLKLRTEDYFVVASTPLPGAAGQGEIKFEEDIAPLEVIPSVPGTPVVFPSKHSIRSRFSLSTTLVHAWQEMDRTTAVLRALFPTLAENLKAPNTLARESSLIGGPVIHEYVSKGAQVRLSENVTGDFTLTLWYFETTDFPPAVAEISFKCATIAGGMPGKAARRALDLFIGLQIDLGDYVNTDHASKTAMALPSGCAGRR
ncbi:hypothetical protein [Phyllobacterium chamaecytisi]|uniref:hypothetical protein n=1 Tax=Phyllobacterium chamaecytisi TaxID=2876082 RepID=UPI001CC9DFDA|nr:hypothetical protein [Phyllobacterium sp. KW56]MBZ9603111.1 hypothetical protein [Phyllobacterium sp. KW56]